MKIVRIWIVEDNNADVFLIELALGRTGLEFEKTIIGDGEKAVRLIMNCGDGLVPPPHILLLDLSLPKLDGKEVLRAIEQCSAFADVGIAVFSSSPIASPTSPTGAKYIQKPADLDGFLRVVTRTVKGLLPPEALSEGTSTCG